MIVVFSERTVERDDVGRFEQLFQPYGLRTSAPYFRAAQTRIMSNDSRAKPFFHDLRHSSADIANTHDAQNLPLDLRTHEPGPAMPLPPAHRRSGVIQFAHGGKHHGDHMLGHG